TTIRLSRARRRRAATDRPPAPPPTIRTRAWRCDCVLIRYLRLLSDSSSLLSVGDGRNRGLRAPRASLTVRHPGRRPARRSIRRRLPPSKPPPVPARVGTAPL